MNGRTSLIDLAKSLALLLAMTAKSHALEPAAVRPDLAALRDSLCSAEIVLLGELPSHGEAQAFMMKADLVDQLVEHCGFDLLLFEAPFYEFILFEERLEHGEASAEMLDGAIGGFWNGPLLEDWRHRLFEQAVNRQLRLGGIDDQISASSTLTRRELPDRLATQLDPDRRAPCKSALERHLFWRYDTNHPYDEAEQQRLAQCASEALANWERANERTEPLGGILHALRSLMGRQAGQEESASRSAAMFERLTWYRSRQPGDKLIVWTATVHAAQQSLGLPHRPLGALSRDLWGAAVKSVAWTTASGQGSMAGSAAYAIPAAPENSLEMRALASAPTADRVVLNQEALARLGSIESRMLGSFQLMDWSEAFDQVVVIHEETPP